MRSPFHSYSSSKRLLRSFAIFSAAAFAFLWESACLRVMEMVGMSGSLGQLRASARDAAHGLAGGGLPHSPAGLNVGRWEPSHEVAGSGARAGRGFGLR